MPRPPARSPAARAFGTALLRRRTARGLTQEGLADASGVHRNTLSLLERGEYAPSLDVLLRIAEGLDVSASELVADVEDDLYPDRRGRTT